jgi:hypothetical protein
MFLLVVPAVRLEFPVVAVVAYMGKKAPPGAGPRRGVQGLLKAEVGGVGPHPQGPDDEDLRAADEGPGISLVSVR